MSGAEKRRDDGKYYSYKIDVVYESGKKVTVWRRYKQFDALRETIQQIIGSSYVLPKLTSKLYLKRSSVRQVAENRLPKIQKFLGQLLTMHSDAVVMKTLQFFLVPNGSDSARAQLADPEDMLKAHDQESEVKLARCVWAYAAAHQGDLTINPGDIVRIISVNEGWAEGELRGEVGLFPSSYVEILEDDDDESEDEQQNSLGHSQGHGKAQGPVEELRFTEQDYVQSLVDVRDNFFPKLRAIITAPEAKTFFNNWAELIPDHSVRLLHPVHCPIFSCWTFVFLFLIVAAVSLISHIQLLLSPHEDLPHLLSCVQRPLSYFLLSLSIYIYIFLSLNLYFLAT